MLTIRRAAILHTLQLLVWGMPVALGVWAVAVVPARPARSAEEILPKHITPKTLQAVRSGLDYLARTQTRDGGWADERGGRQYPLAVSSLAGMALLANGNTPTRGRYAKEVQAALTYVLNSVKPDSGLITSPSQDSGMPMHGHGFGLLFLGSCYGMEVKPSEKALMKERIGKAIQLTAKAQSPFGGWIYWPGGGGDEGSVTVTQIQALRACHNAGFVVPKGTIELAVRYIDRCSTPEGGICYSLGSGGGPQLAISAAAIATLYNAGEYDAPIATRCLNYVFDQFKAVKGWSKNSGHSFYANLYAAQGFYLAGDKYWDAYFPETRDELLRMQQSDGSWDGDGIGRTYGTAIALIILQLPYKFLPIYQR